jgi:hypothetical protein
MNAVGVHWAPLTIHMHLAGPGATTHEWQRRGNHASINSVKSRVKKSSRHGEQRYMSRFASASH